MGKYSEGVYYALKKDPKFPEEDTEYNKEIAEYIANSATDNKLKKKLWIEIFRNYSESGGDSQDPKKRKKIHPSDGSYAEKPNIKNRRRFATYY